MRVQLAAHVHVARRDAGAARKALGVGEAGLVGEQLGARAFDVGDEQLHLQVYLAGKEVGERGG